MTNVLNAEKRTSAALDKDARLHGRASADSVPSPTRLTSVSPVGAADKPGQYRSVGRSKRVV